MEKRFFANLEIDFIILLICISLIVLVGMNFTSASSGSNGTMTVEVDIVGFTPQAPFVEIEVPDYIFLGNLTKKTKKSNEVKLYINNTGNVNVSVTPQLKDSSEKIFSYLYFRTRKNVNGSNIEPKRIGDYSLIINQSSQSIGSEYCYMQLDLNDYGDSINQDIIGHKADVIFFAMSQ